MSEDNATVEREGERVPHVTRPPVKRALIEGTLRRRIVEGELPPGSLLPSRDALCKTFKASIHTVQRAVDRLVADRFVISRAGDGTYVAPRPPHLAQFALIFAHNPVDGYSVWSRFWQALIGEATRIGRETDREILPFYGVYGPSDAEDYQRLLELVRRQRLAGLIFASAPNWLSVSELFDLDVPRVAIMSQAQAGTPAVTPDHLSFVRRALDHLVRCGRKRIAALFSESGANAMEKELRAGALARGLRIEPYWMQSAGLVDVKWACNIAHLLMNPNQTKKPDGFIIADDNLVEAAAAGIHAAGARVGEDVEIVAHCNYPIPPNTVVPVTRLGFDAGRLIELCIENIELQRRGKRFPRLTKVAARFEGESNESGAKRT